MELAKQRCIPCEGGVPPLVGQQLDSYKSQLDQEAAGWELKSAKKLEQTFKFKDFVTALDFVNKVGELAETEGHHPNIELGWGFARILIWTHAIDGLSQADFALAAKISSIKQS
jgi:4a-hydroxytetrahydrobiopterin dehydratase